MSTMTATTTLTYQTYVRATPQAIWSPRSP